MRCSRMQSSRRWWRRDRGRMTPADLKSARHTLGLSAEGMARLLHVQSGRTVRRWEAGDRDIPGPVIVLIKAMMASPAVRRYFVSATKPVLDKSAKT